MIHTKHALTRKLPRQGLKGIVYCLLYLLLPDLSLEAVWAPDLALLRQEEPEESSTAEWKPLERLEADEFGRSTTLATFDADDAVVGFVVAVVVGGAVVIGDAKVDARPVLRSISEMAESFPTEQVRNSALASAG